jgi:hypothetical protein
LGKGITDEWFKEGGFKTYKRPAKEKYEVASEPGTINTLEGPVNYPKGFYIMTGPKGEQYPISPEKFNELKDDLGNGVCTPKKIMKIAKLADHSGTVDTSCSSFFYPSIGIIARTTWVSIFFFLI